MWIRIRIRIRNTALYGTLNCEGICCGPDLPAERAVHAAQVAVHG
jgi:hypothetical protein